MPRSPVRVAESFPAIGLDELDAAAALRDRVDVKYVVPVELVAALAERLRATHAVLEIDGRRAFGYRTTYFDTAELRAYRDHLQQRRRRYKCRSREYVDSGDCSFEVKLKGARGRTVKHRMAYDRDRRDELSAPALEFVRECLARTYGRTPDGELRAVLAMAFTRVTFVAPALGERLTCDYDLAFSAPDGSSGRLAEGLAIVESKSPRGNAVADRALRALGARPEPGCSKYCLGVGFTNPRVNNNGLRPLLRRRAHLPRRDRAARPGLAAPPEAAVQDRDRAQGAAAGHAARARLGPQRVLHGPNAAAGRARPRRRAPHGLGREPRAPRRAVAQPPLPRRLRADRAARARRPARAGRGAARAHG